MLRASRVAEVPLESARATQGEMQWSRFEAGKHPPALVKGYGDLPVAVRKRNGEHLIFDGHHRTVLAIEGGADAMRMHVIDAADYAPEFAGRAAAARTISDDDLLAQLEDPFAPVRPFIATLPPETQAAAFRQGMAQLVDGRPVDVTPAILAAIDPDEAMARALRNADAVDGASPHPIEPAPELTIADLQERLAGLQERIGELPELDPDLKLQRDAVKAASLCLMRSA